MPSFQHRAGHFFLESAVILYDDLARRASTEGAEAALRQRQIDSASRLIELIAQHGDGDWNKDIERLRRHIAAGGKQS